MAFSLSISVEKLCKNAQQTADKTNCRNNQNNLDRRDAFLHHFVAAKREQQRQRAGKNLVEQFSLYVEQNISSHWDKNAQAAGHIVADQTAQNQAAHNRRAKD